MTKKYTIVISNPTEPIGLGMTAFGGTVSAAYDVDLGESFWNAARERYQPKWLVEQGPHIYNGPDWPLEELGAVIAEAYNGQTKGGV